MTTFPEDVAADANRLRVEWLNQSKPDMSMTAVTEAIAMGIMHGRSQVREWQPMSTAPTNGKHVILAVRSGAFIYSVQGACFDGVWSSVDQDNAEPLAWMPNVRLPEWATQL